MLVTGFGDVGSGGGVWVGVDFVDFVGWVCVAAMGSYFSLDFRF